MSLRSRLEDSGIEYQDVEKDPLKRGTRIHGMMEFVTHGVQTVAISGGDPRKVIRRIMYTAAEATGNPLKKGTESFVEAVFTRWDIHSPEADMEGKRADALMRWDEDGLSLTGIVEWKSGRTFADDTESQRKLNKYLGQIRGYALQWQADVSIIVYLDWKQVDFYVRNGKNMEYRATDVWQGEKWVTMRKSGVINNVHITFEHDPRFYDECDGIVPGLKQWKKIGTKPPKDEVKDKERMIRIKEEDDDGELRLDSD